MRVDIDPPRIGFEINCASSMYSSSHLGLHTSSGPAVVGIERSARILHPYHVFIIFWPLFFSLILYLCLYSFLSLSFFQPLFLSPLSLSPRAAILREMMCLQIILFTISYAFPLVCHVPSPFSSCCVIYSTRRTQAADQNTFLQQTQPTKMSAPLPDFWSEKKDPRGKTYYSNRQTRKTSWTVSGENCTWIE